MYLWYDMKYYIRKGVVPLDSVAIFEKGLVDSQAGFFGGLKLLFQSAISLLLKPPVLVLVILLVIASVYMWMKKNN